MVAMREVVNMEDVRRPGRPVFDEVKAGYVLAMARLGLNRTEVGGVLGLSAVEVEEVYGEAFAAGAEHSLGAVLRSLYRAATDPGKPNVAACRWYLQALREREAAEMKAMEAARGTPKSKPRPSAAKLGKMPKAKKAAPAKAAPKAPPLGIKAQRELDAKTADKGTAWEGLL